MLSKHGINIALVVALMVAMCQQPAEAKGLGIKKILFAPARIAAKIGEKVSYYALAIFLLIEDQLEDE